MADLLRVSFPAAMVVTIVIAVGWTDHVEKRERDRDHVKEHRRFLSDLRKVMSDKK